MSIKRHRVFEKPTLRDLIGKPALLNSESRADYDSLRVVIEREIGPQTIFDEMRVQDLTDKIWEEQRIKRQQIAIIQSAKVESLASLLSPHYGDDVDAALETSRNYFSGDQQKSCKAQIIIEQLGVTRAQIEANGISVRSLALLSLDRMISNRETVRNSLIRDHERRQRKADKAKRKTPFNDN